MNRISPAFIHRLRNLFLAALFTRSTLFFLLKALAIVGTGTLVLYPTLFGGWAGDDGFYIIHNDLLKDPHRLWKAWFEPGSFVEYYPLEQTIQYFQWELWGIASPFNYILTNLVLHLASALLVWRLFSKLGLRLAWLGGLIYAIYPPVVDSVGLSCELKNTLSLPPFLLAMCFYLDYENKRKLRYYFLALALFLIAMLCKITMYFFPIIILLYAWWKRDRITWKDALASLPFFIIALSLGFITVHAGSIYAITIHDKAPGPIHLGGLFDRLALVGISLTFYFGHSFLPWPEVPLYPLWSVDPPSPWYLIPWIGIAFVALCCWKKRDDWGRPVIFGLGFFILGLAPFLGLNETAVMCLTWVQDHFLYIPIIGLIGLVSAGIEHISPQLPKRIRWVGMALGILALELLGSQTLSYSDLFVDKEQLWRANLVYSPDSWFARYLLGLAFITKGDTEAAIDNFKESVRINPDFNNAQTALAGAYIRTNRMSEALEPMQETVRINPGSSIAHYNLGILLLQLGHLSDAVDQLTIVMNDKPDSVEARHDLGLALAQEGRIKDAIVQFEAALRILPGNPLLTQQLAELKKMSQ